MTIYRGPGGGGNATTDAELTLLTQLEQSASASAAAADASADAAASSETAAAGSASAAASSASVAATSATNAASSATAAASSATAASSSASGASTSASNAASSASAASTSATNAASSATAAASSATAAAASETAAASSATTASTAATNASNSASSASTSASNASSSASAAATSATNASNSATAAATSATNASNSASAASTSETNAAASETAAALSETNAATSETNAASSASAASTSASNAATSETNAAGSASAAAGSATSASNSASSASTSATNASNSAGAAATSAFNAATSATNAAASAAAAAVFDPALYLAKADNLSGLANTATARTNLGVAIGTDVQAYSAVLTGYSSTGIGFRNRIINGDMRIDQRNAGASVTLNGSESYITDRFACGEVTDGAFTAQQVADAPTGFVNSLKCTITSADASLGSTQTAYCFQSIEGLNVSDLAWGTASASAITLSFWVKSSLTGTFGGALRNSAANRSYPYSYTISSANTWEQKTVTIPGDTSGTWLTTNGVGINLQFSLGAGSDRTGTAGAWNANNNTGATGQVQVISTLSATWQITGVQLEAGSVATPFERRPYGTELALCQRYFQATSGLTYAFYSAINASMYMPMTLQTEMRASPTATIVSTASIGSGGTVSLGATPKAAVFQVLPGSASGARYGFDSGSFTFSAEL